MATVKKTPAPAKTIKVAFPTPAPKGAKAAAPVKASVVKPIKQGQMVNVKQRNGNTVSGKVKEVNDKPNGRWIVVNISTDKKKPELVTARVSQVTHA